MLEAVLAVVIIAALLLLIGVPLDVIIGGLAALLMLGVVLTAAVFVLFFLAADISLFFFRPARGKFLRFDEGERFDRAVYLSLKDNLEYTCLFPAEGFARARIYSPEKERLLFTSRLKKRKTAYDRHSLLIILLGNLFSVLVCIGAFALLPALF